jgi:hypothetical protein
MLPGARGMIEMIKNELSLDERTRFNVCICAPDILPLHNWIIPCALQIFAAGELCNLFFHLQGYCYLLILLRLTPNSRHRLAARLNIGACKMQIANRFQFCFASPSVG